MILLFACHPIRWFTPNVTVTWDPPTKLENGSSILPGEELWYYVYIDKDRDKTHEDKELLTPEPIKGTSIEIDRSELADTEQKGHYFIGVQAVLYINGQPKQSKISWSDSKAATNNNRFGVRME